MSNESEKKVLTLAQVDVLFHDVGKEVLALKDLSFSIPAGSFVSLIGPSGAGKSTLLRTILGLMPIARGTIVRNFKRPGMVFQNYALFPWLSAIDNVAFGLHMHGMPDSGRMRIAREMLKEVGLEHVAHQYPATLSGGQRQRVGLARALAISPDFLILDEPFSNLDTITAELLKTDLLRIWNKYHMTILMVNHLIPDAIELSDRIILMGAHPGQIKKVLAVDLERPRNPRSPSFFQEVDELTELIRAVS
jgi:NitT/TauT family transport system ATP-binding protein